MAHTPVVTGRASAWSLHRPPSVWRAQLGRRLPGFVAVGCSGVVVNLGVMAALVAASVHYPVAAIVAAQVSILTNFALHDRFVFHDARGGRPLWRRLVTTAVFNNAEALLRLPLLVALVELAGLGEVVAQAATLLVSFVARFLFVSRVVYVLPHPARGVPS